MSSRSTIEDQGVVHSLAGYKANLPALWLFPGPFPSSPGRHPILRSFRYRYKSTFPLTTDGGRGRLASLAFCSDREETRRCCRSLRDAFLQIKIAHLLHARECTSSDRESSHFYFLIGGGVKGSTARHSQGLRGARFDGWGH